MFALLPRPARSSPRRLLLSSGFALVLLAGCGTGTTQATTDAGATAATTAAAATGGTGGAGGGNGATLQAFRDCLSQHGVTLPSRGAGQGGGGGTGQGGTGTGATGQGAAGQGGNGQGGGGNFGLDQTDPTVQAAMDACASLRPAGGVGRGGANFQAFQAYRSCLKDNGVTVPDITRPNGTGAGGTGTGGSGTGGSGGSGAGQTPGSRPANPALFGIDPSDPNLAAAQAKCQVLLPTATVPAAGSTPTSGQA